MRTYATGLTADQIAILQSSSAEVAAALDPIALAKHVVSELHARFGYELPSVYLLQADGTLELAAQIGYRNPPRTVSAGRGIMGSVLRTGRPRLLRNATKVPDYRGINREVTADLSDRRAA